MREPEAAARMRKTEWVILAFLVYASEGAVF
jgi:hypothetical protein